MIRSSLPGRPAHPAVWLFAAVVISLLTFSACGDLNNSSKPSRIALYAGQGADSASVARTEELLLRFDLPVDRLDAGQTNADLNDYLLYVIPGGEPDAIAAALGTTGRSRIRALVESGGGFIGLGGGAYLAASSMRYHQLDLPYESLDFYTGSAEGPSQVLLPGEQQLVTIHDLRFDPLLLSPVTMEYQNGPSLIVQGALGLELIATLDQSGTVTALLLRYGIGRVALCSMQPEALESSRFLLQHMVEWCLRRLGQ